MDGKPPDLPTGQIQAQDPSTKPLRGNEATRFKPGQSGNPLGKPAFSAEVKALKRQNHEHTEKALHGMALMTVPILQAKLKDPTSTAMEAAIASIILRSVQDGDPGRLSFLWDRMFGKVVERTENLNVNAELDPDEYRALDREALYKLVGNG